MLKYRLAPLKHTFSVSGETFKGKRNKIALKGSIE